MWRGKSGTWSLLVGGICICVVWAVDYLPQCGTWSSARVTVETASIKAKYPSFGQLMDYIDQPIPRNITLSMCMHPQHASFLWTHCMQSCAHEEMKSDKKLVKSIFDRHCSSWLTVDKDIDFITDSNLRSSLGWILPLPEQRESLLLETASQIENILQRNQVVDNHQQYTSLPSLCLTDKTDLNYIIEIWTKRLIYLFTNSELFDSFSHKREMELLAHIFNLHASFFTNKEIVLGQVFSYTKASQQILSPFQHLRLKQEVMTIALRLIETVFIAQNKKTTSEFSLIQHLFNDISISGKDFDYNTVEIDLENISSTFLTLLEQQLSQYSRRVYLQFEQFISLYGQLRTDMLLTCTGITLPNLPLLLQNSSSVCNHASVEHKYACLFGHRYPQITSPMPLVQHHLPREFVVRDGMYRVSPTIKSSQHASSKKRRGKKSQQRLLIPTLAFVLPLSADSGAMVRFITEAVLMGYRWIHVPRIASFREQTEMDSTINVESSNKMAFSYGHWEDSVDLVMGDALAQLLSPLSSENQYFDDKKDFGEKEFDSSRKSSVQRSDLFISLTISLDRLWNYAQELQETQPSIRREYRRSFGGTRSTQTINWQITLTHYLTKRLQSFGLLYVDTVVLDATWETSSSFSSTQEEHEESLLSVYAALQSLLCPMGKFSETFSGSSNAKEQLPGTCFFYSLGLTQVSSTDVMDRIVNASPTSLPSAHNHQQFYNRPVVYMQPHSLYKAISQDDKVYLHAKQVHNMFVVFTDPAVMTSSTTLTKDTLSNSVVSTVYAEQADPILTILAEAHTQHRQHFFTTMLNDTLRPFLKSPMSYTAVYHNNLNRQYQTSVSSTASHRMGHAHVGTSNTHPRTNAMASAPAHKQRYKQMLSSLYGDSIDVDHHNMQDMHKPAHRENRAATNLQEREENELEFERLLRDQEPYPWMYDVDSWSDDTILDDTQWVASLLESYAYTSPRQLLILYYLSHDVGLAVSLPVVTVSEYEELETIHLLEMTIGTVLNHVVYYDEFMDESVVDDKDDGIVSYFADYGLRKHEVRILDSIGAYMTMTTTASISHMKIDTDKRNINFDDYERQFQGSLSPSGSKDASITNLISEKFQMLLNSLAPSPATPVARWLRSYLPLYPSSHPLHPQQLAENYQKLQQVQYWQRILLEQDMLVERLQQRQRRTQLRALYRSETSSGDVQAFFQEHNHRNDDDKDNNFNHFVHGIQGDPTDDETQWYEEYEDPLLDGVKEEEQLRLDHIFAAA